MSTYINFTLIKLDNPDYFPPLSDVAVAWFFTVVVKFTDQDWVSCIKSEKSAWKVLPPIAEFSCQSKKGSGSKQGGLFCLWETIKRSSNHLCFNDCPLPTLFWKYAETK